MSKSISVYDVFTPSSPACLTFVERTSINQKLDRALRTKGKQIVLYGHSGTGKTTIIKNKIPAFYPRKIVTRCEKGISVENLILDAFNQLDIYYKETIETSDNSKVGGSLSAKFLGIQAQLNSELAGGSKETLKKLVSIQLTSPTLAKFIGEAECCWIIEDFHKVIAGDKERLSQIMKVFMDLADEYPKLKIITIGAVNTAREVLVYDKEMKNRVAEINVPLMDAARLKQIIEKGEQLLNIRFEDTIKEKIVSFSSGLPAVTHNLCLLMCELKGINERKSNDKLINFNQGDLKKAVQEFIKENEDTYKAIFEKATYCRYARQYEHPKELLYAVLDSEKEEVGINDVAAVIKRRHPQYKQNNLKQYLDELTETERDEVLRYHKASNSYYFSNPFFKSYVAAKQFEDLQKVTLTKTTILKKMSNYLNELNLGRLQFLKDFEEFEDEFTDTYDEVEDEEEI